MYRVGRLVMICILLATLFLTGPAGMASRVAAAQTAPIRLRIGVTTDGIVQLTPSDLATAGVDPASVDPRTFAMSSMGQPVAIQVTANEDSSFDQGERVLFFGQKFRGTQFEEKYTDERVYWLDIGGAAGPRIAEKDASPQGDLTPPQDIAATVHAEVNTLWDPLRTTVLVNVTQDTWFWNELQPTAMKPVTATVGYVVPDPAPGSVATFRLVEIAKYSNSSAQPEHRTVVTLNGATLLDQTWGGPWVHELTATVPADRFVSGHNSVEVSSRVMPGNYIDDILVNYWELDYRRLFRAWQGQFDFYAEASGPHEYVVSNWASKPVAVWDITDAAQPAQLTGAIPTFVDSKTQLHFRTDDGAGARYWLQEEAAFQHPATVRPRLDAGLRNPARGADTVIITPAEFRPAAERLASWHEAHGRRTVVADLQDVYDEFNEGIRIAPEAIPNMLRWAAAHWPGPVPAYLTLMGDGHWNMKGINPATYGTTPNYMPPYLAFVDPWWGEIPTDMRYGDLDGDGLPEVSVGRLTANSLAEAEVVVGKVVNYDETFRSAHWQRRALFVADDPDTAGDFPALSDEILTNYLPPDLTATRAYLPGSNPEQILATRQIILDTIQSGVWQVQFTGHGNVQKWTSQLLLRVQDIAGLKNGDKLPIVMSFDCRDGNFFYPQEGFQSIAELMQRQQGGGAIAAISPSSDGVSPDQQAFRRILMTVMFTENVREIGKALDLSKRRYAAQNGARYLIEGVTLFGDPAMRLPLAATSPTPHHVYLPLTLR